MLRFILPATLATAFLFALVCSAGSVTPTAAETENARQWAADRLLNSDPARLPFSFVYGGQPSQKLLGTWRRTEKTEEADSTCQKRTITYADPQTGLQCRCEAVVYRDFPTVEWTLFFRNNGNSETPILENVNALDAAWQCAAGSDFLLHHADGSPAKRNDYAPRETPLPAKAAKRFGGAGGRPTNSDWSYFNLQFGGEGVILAVGWPGQWAAQFTRDAERGLAIRAGQEALRAKLLPGEEIRTPLIVLQFWQGDYARSQNVWRRWMMAHSMPRPAGHLPPPQFLASSSRAYREMIDANEQNQIMHINRYLEEGLKLDYWWMDAGWYIQQKGWPQVGTWEVDPKRFPRGLRPISDHAHSKGVKILVWFEPERVAPGTWLYENHPEWLLDSAAGKADSMKGLRSWSSSEGGSDPSVTYNPTIEPRSMANVRWDPGRLAFHPGPQGQYSVVRFTAPENDSYKLRAAFFAIDRDTTTDVHVLHNGKSLFDGRINLGGQGKRAAHDAPLALAKGDRLDFVVGWGNGAHVCDSTGLEVALETPSGKTLNAAKEFNPEKNPSGPWSYGWLKSGPSPDSETFRLYDRSGEAGGHANRLLNLGNADARHWLTEHVDKLLTEHGIDLYRQDFNIDPLAFWRAADAADRQGMTENKYVCGYLAHWDELRRRHPNMLIDSCASGGRRNDLETMRRSVPLWRSDYAYEPIGHQCMTYGISLWLPYHGTGTVASSAAPYYGGGFTAVEPYAFWSNAAPSLGIGIDVRVREIDYAALRRLYGQWRELSQCYYGDFYPLTPYTQDLKQWIGWQFNVPERGCGAVQAFRRPDNPDAEVKWKLRDLDPDTPYAIRFFDGQEERQIHRRATGSELMNEGLAISLPAKPDAAVVLYTRQ